MSRELFACFYVDEFPVQAMLRLRPELRASPVAVLEGEPPFEHVCSMNALARKLGIEHGIPRAQLEMFSGVKVLRRSLGEEQAAENALLDCIFQFSPRVESRKELRSGYVVADLAGTERLLGPAEIAVHRMLGDVTALGMHARAVVSGNFHTAVYVARSAPQRCALVIPQGGELSALRDLSLSVLDLAPEYAELFAYWGIRTLGELGAMPEEGMMTRLGSAGIRLRQLARGEHPHLFAPSVRAAPLEEHTEMETPVELLDSLLFAIHPLLEQLVLRATARSQAIAAIHLTLTLEGRKDYTRVVRPALSSSDKGFLLKLIQLDLAAHPPGAAVVSLHLAAQTGAGNKVQLGLFSPQLPEPSRLDVTLARITAIVGEGRAGRAALDDTHRPDTFHLEPFFVADAAECPPESSRGYTAVRRLRPSQPVRVTLRGDTPHTLFLCGLRYSVDCAYGPWTSDGAWWSETSWSAEVWDVVAHAEISKATVCCCLALDRRRDVWHIEAFYD